MLSRFLDGRLTVIFSLIYLISKVNAAYIPIAKAGGITPLSDNVRWGEEDTFSWCFEGIPQNSIVSIGTIASGLRNSKNYELFEKGFFKMIEILRPHTIIIYGSDKYPCIESVRQQIQIVQFNSERALAFEEASS